MTDATELYERLDEETAWSLLRSRPVGRLALSVAGSPDIVPVNFFGTEDRRILIRTAPGTKLLELAINARVAFEVDDWDAASAWSVVVKGTAQRLDRDDDRALPSFAGALRPWSPSFKNTWVVIAAEEITARRFRRGQPAQEIDDSSTD